MSFHFSPTNKNRLKNIRKSFNNSISKTKKNLINNSNNLNKNNNNYHSGNLNIINLNRGETPNNHHQKLMMINASTTNNNNDNQQIETKKSLNNKTTNIANFNNYLQSSTMMPSVKSRLIKNISRTKEKILQGMGKNDRTSDENFDLYVDNFENQHSQANKLNKELNKYLNSLKETQKSSKTFYDTLRETFEPNWPMSNQFAEQIEQLESKWAEYLAKLHKDVQLPLMSYLNEFPELKKKIEKRCNRLLDYDNARHNLEHAQNKTAKKSFGLTSTLGNTNTVNTSGGSSSSSSSTSHTSNHASQTTTDQLTKLTKLKIDLEDKQHIYEEINQTLCLALPVLFENRIKFYSSIFQTFFHTETIFHSDCVESKSKLDEICENLSIKTNSQFFADPQDVDDTNTLSNSNSDFNNQIPSIDGEYPSKNNHLDYSNENNHNTSSNNSFSESSNNHHHNNKLTIVNGSSDEHPTKNITEFVPKSDLNDHGLHSSDDELESENKRNHPKQQNTSSLYTILATQLTNITNNTNNNNNNNNNHSKNNTNGHSHNESSNNHKNINDHFSETKFKLMYKVKATYPYEAKEIDELTFSKDDIITVVEGSESEKEDLDDGWLIGVHEITNKRGLFPENFTKRI